MRTKTPIYLICDTCFKYWKDLQCQNWLFVSLKMIQEIVNLELAIYFLSGSINTVVIISLNDCKLKLYFSDRTFWANLIPFYNCPN